VDFVKYLRLSEFERQKLEMLMCARMYAIDMQYNAYESKLTHESKVRVSGLPNHDRPQHDVHVDRAGCDPKIF